MEQMQQPHETTPTPAEQDEERSEVDWASIRLRLRQMGDAGLRAAAEMLARKEQSNR